MAFLPLLAQTPSGLAGGDEFVGPFASWANVRTAYGAVGNGVADDTAAFQNALSDIGNPGRPLVLYVPAGTYKITNTLVLALRRNVSVIGENPANTILRWAGPANGEMLYLNSVPFSRFGRITWDGAGTAYALVDHGWTGIGNFGGTSYDEHADEVFENAAFGIRGGTGGLQEGETAILRCTFSHLNQAGISIENYNALDWYIWDSTFTSNARGITNIFGAGNFQVYSSYFQNSSVADVQINATSYFGLRDNYSVGSNAFFVAAQVGSPAAPVTLQNNIILDSRTTPIQIGNPGPLLMLDNVFRSAVGQNGPVVSIAEAYTSAPSARVVAIGNTYTVPSPYSVQGTLINEKDSIVARSSLNPAAPVMPSTPLSYSRKVFDVASGADAAAIQTAINQAAALNGQRPVIHLQPGSYSIAQTLTVPANTDLQLVGDGASPVGGTQLTWSGTGYGPVLWLAGPSHAILRDLSITGTGTSIGLLADNVDQPGARIFTQEFQAEGGQQAGLAVNRLQNSELDLENAYIEGNGLGITAIGGPKAVLGTATGRNGFFAGFSADNDLTYNVASSGQLNVQGVWYEGAPAGFIQFTDSGNFTFDGGVIAAQDPNHGGVASPNPTIGMSGFHGNVTIANAFLLTRNRVAIDSSTVSVLGLGLVAPPDNANIFTVTNSPSAQSAMMNSRQLNATGGSISLGDQILGVSDVNAFLQEMLAPLRAIQPHTFAAIPTGVTDLRLYRVSVDNHIIGAALEPAPLPFVTSQALAKIRSNYAGWVGMQFSVGSMPMRVMSVGRICAPGNSKQHIVKLVHASVGIDVSGGAATVNMSACAPGQYVYAPLPAPLVLNAGSSYYLVSQETNGGDAWYDLGAVGSSAAGTISAGAFGPGGAWTSAGSAGNAYGPPNLLYQVDVLAPLSAAGTAIPPPIVSITSPAQGATVSGTINFVASASAQAGLAAVQLKVDNANFGALMSAAPFSAALDTTTLTNGSHALSAVAVDNSGQTTTATINVTVNNQTTPPPPPPVVTATTPLLAGQSPASPRNNITQWVGYEFTVGATPLTLTSLGRMVLAGNSGSHPVKLARVSDNTDVPGAQVVVSTAGVAPGTYAYSQLASPITLLAGTSYYLVDQEFQGGDLWYDISAITPSPQVTIPGAIYVDPSSGAYELVAVPNLGFVFVNALFSTAGAPPPDSTAPTVLLTAPANNSTISGTMTITAAASDNVAVASVQFMLDGNPIGALDTSAPWSMTYDTRQLTNGQYTLSAVAKDAAGNSATSSTVTITVNNSAAGQNPFVTSFTPGTLRNNTTQWVGNELTVGSAPLTIYSLGRICIAGNTGTHTVKLVSATNSADLAGGSVQINMSGCTPGQFAYVSLPASVTLAAGSSWYFVSWETAGGDLWYDMLPLVTAGSAKVTGAVYWDGQNYDPVALPSYSFVPISFRF